MNPRSTASISPLASPLSAKSNPPSAPASNNGDLDRSLIQRFQKTRDTRVQEHIVKRHERLVWSIAWRYRGHNEPVEDLAQEGFIGLIRAIERYDCTSPAKFSSYASVKIAGCIEHYLRDRGSVIRQPGWVQELLTRIRKEGQRLSQELGRTPSMAEIAQALGETVERVSSALETNSTQSVSSLDEPMGGTEADSPSLSDVIADDDERETSRLLDDRMDLERAMSFLDGVHRQALQLCFFEDLTFEEAGGRMGMDRHRTRRVVNRAVRMLRKQLQAS